MLQQPTIVNWCSYLWVLYMAGDYEMALQCMESTTEVALQDENKESYWMSELLLFTAMIHHKMGNQKKAIKSLEKKEAHIVDHVRYNNLLSKYYMENNSLKKALTC